MCKFVPYNVQTYMQDKRHVSLEGLELKLRSAWDERGMLTFAEVEKDIPFAIKRMFWITDVPYGAKRGGHSHSTCMEMVCCVKGWFSLLLDNGRERCSFFMDTPTRGVIIPAGVWCTLEDFSEDCVVVVCASEEYSREGYTWDYEEFLQKNGEMIILTNENTTIQH